MNTIQDVCDEYGFGMPSQLNGYFWVVYDARDRRVVVRFDPQGKTLQIFRAAEFLEWK